MADVDINKFRASVVREGSKPASPGFIVSEGQSPTDPAGSGQNHLPVTIAEAATGLSITDSQVLGGAGTVGQYIRGDGSLADFPESSGGGSSVSYYLNGSISQGTIGGVAYKELNKVPILGAGTDFTINADGYIASFLTDAGDPNLLEIPGGNWNFETYFSSSSSGGTPSFYVELYKYDGSTFTLLASNSTFPELIAFGTNITAYFSTLAVPTTALALTDRLAIRYYVTHSGRTITLHTEDNHLCQIVTTFTTGITALNGLTAQVQNFAVGTSGTDFAIASATATHTFNLPTASATNRGALSSADWTTFNNKTSNLGTVTSVGLSSATSGVTIGSTPVTTSGTITLAIATASGSQNGLLSSTDWTTFNSKQNALTNPVTGTGASGQVAYFTGTTAISSESNLFWDATNDRLGIGVNNPLTSIHIIKALGNDVISIGETSNGQRLIIGQETSYTGNYINSTNVNLKLQSYTDGGTGGNIIFQTGIGSISTRLTITNTGASIFTSSITASSFIKSLGTSSQFLKADGSVDSTSYQTLLTNPVTGTGTSGQVSYWNGTNSITSDSDLLFDGSNLTVGGNIILTTGANRFLRLGSASSYYYNLQATNDDFQILEAGSTPRFTIKYPNGNVLIGTNTDSGAKLNIRGSFSANPVSIEADAGGNQLALTRIGAIAEFYMGGSSFGSTQLVIRSGFSGGVLLSAGSTGWVSASDIRLKNIGKKIENAIENLSQLQTIYYSWKNSTNQKEHLGLIAQEVEKQFPEIVTESEIDGMKGVNYTELIPVLIAAVKELKQEIDTLKN